MKRTISLLLSLVMVLALLPFSAFSVGAETFTDSQGVEYTLSDDTTYYIVSDCDESVTSLVIPKTYKGLPVKEIGNSAFYYCDSLTSIEIPVSVTYIGDYAFEWCRSLTSIEIPDSVTYIGSRAFGSCYNLTSIEIPVSVTYIGSSAFAWCRSLTSIEIPETAVLGSDIFDNCDSLVFTEYENIEYYGTDSNPYQIVYDVIGFSLETYTIHPDAKQIAGSAFAYCNKLTSIEMGNSVTFIGYGVFYDCDSLTSIEIPNSVTSISGGVFGGCDSLETITVASGNETYHSDGNCLIETESKTLVAGCKNSIIPTDGSVTTIGDHAFARCSSLTSIEIPDSVTTIGNGAFLYCDLTSIEIPDSVTTIGSSAFAYCDLTSIEIPDSVTYIGDHAFYVCDSLTDIYCEVESQPDGWSSDWKYSCDATVHWGAKMSGSVEEPETGDINGNGQIDSMDYLYLKRAFFKQYVLADISIGDINKNGEIDSMDYLYLKRAFFKQYVIDNDDIIVDDSTPTDKPEAGEWTWTNGGNSTIIGTCGENTKTINLNIDHLPDEYENEDGSYGRLSVKRDKIFSSGDWIVYFEKSIFETGKGYNAGAVYYKNMFKIKTDGTQQTNLSLVYDLIGSKDDYLYFLVATGDRTSGVPERTYLYKIKMTDDVTSLYKQGTEIAEIEMDQGNYHGDGYIEGDWIYYTEYDAYIERDLFFKMKLDGTERQIVED